MIVMNVQIDNFLGFREFEINMSYPKKIVGSSIENEFLSERPNFRYKKVNIIMGANATGKTSFGKMLMKIFNFIYKKEYKTLVEAICDRTSEATFSIDFIGNEKVLYRISAKIAPPSSKDYLSSDITVDIKSVNINLKDSYESCAKRLDLIENERKDSYIEELEKVKGLSWLFRYPSDSAERYKVYTPDDVEKYLRILQYTLKTLDPMIKSVEKIDNVENAYVIKMKYGNVIMQNGELIQNDILSSGTKEGIEVARVFASIISNQYGFYYCDEKFSYIHSDLEKAFLASMIQSLNTDDQLFFTTHNSDILDLNLPKHSFVFFKKETYGDEHLISCVQAADYLKRNTDSLKNAVENDLFSVSPNVDLIYKITKLRG